jgi:RimJ/RimL family protein N-acetyltransferase
MSAESEIGAESPVLMLRGSLVGLGPLDRRHIPLYLRWMNDPEVTRGLGRGGPYTREMEEDWFERASTGKAGVQFTIYELEALRPIGTVGLDAIDHYRASATFGISIGEKSCWNRGYGTEATRLTLDYAFTMLNLQNVTLSVYSFNPRAQRAYEKAGFRVIGRQRRAIPLAGERYDVILMDAIPEEFESPVLKAVLTPEQGRG